MRQAQADGDVRKVQGDAAAAAARPFRWRSLLMFLSVVGPGIITANADNDVGGVLTYSQAGAQFGYSLLWLLIPVTLALVVTQEMCARMGVVTGKGLADLIRENFGVKVTFWVLLLFVICDLGNTATEFAGIASVAPIFGGFIGIANAGLCKTVLVVACAILVFFVVTRANRDVVERIFFVLCTVYISYVVSAVIVRPDWKDVAHQMIFPHFASSKAYVLMIIAIIGTTISPWMQFYIQAAIVEKGVRESQYGASRIDVISGALVTDIIAFFIVVACAATIFMHNLSLPAAHQIQVNGVSDVAVALQPLAGRFAALLFAIGLLNAALFTASILPLSTAYYVCEAFGFERGIDRRLGDAKVFYGLYLSFIVIGAGVVIVPNAPLLGIIFYSQVLNGVLMLLLINNKRLMGTWTNGLAFNVIAWTTVVIVSVLTAISTAQLVFPQIGS
jgi:NRAMP (natural resistance-associated macrophage protein)-like metal ion transporter